MFNGTYRYVSIIKHKYNVHMYFTAEISFQQVFFTVCIEHIQILREKNKTHIVMVNSEFG